MTTPTCPPGTVQVGITTVRYPEGDKTCIICKDCPPPADIDCYPLDCCTPELIAAGYTCVTQVSIAVEYFDTSGSFWRPTPWSPMRTGDGTYSVTLERFQSIYQYVFTWVSPCGVTSTFTLPFFEWQIPVAFRYTRTPEVGFLTSCESCP